MPRNPRQKSSPIAVEVTKAVLWTPPANSSATKGGADMLHLTLSTSRRDASGIILAALKNMGFDAQGVGGHAGPELTHYVFNIKIGATMLGLVDELIKLRKMNDHVDDRNNEQKKLHPFPTLITRAEAFKHAGKPEIESFNYTSFLTKLGKAVTPAKKRDGRE